MQDAVIGLSRLPARQVGEQVYEGLALHGGVFGLGEQSLQIGLPVGQNVGGDLTLSKVSWQCWCRVTPVR
jgi:hypothetical protein